MLLGLRAIFLVLSVFIGVAIGQQYDDVWRGGFVAFGISFCALVLEQAFARRFIGIISILMLGLLAGFVLSNFVIAALYLIPALRDVIVDPQAPFLRLYVEFSITFFLCSLCVVAILHTKDEFKFVIPFVELKREGGGGHPVLLDTSAIIDGRIVDVIETRAIDNPVVIPRFVLEELQQVADSADKVKRNRGRRGLDLLNRLQKSKVARIEIQEVTLPQVEGVDSKLVHMAKMLDARIVTTDFNLNKVAQVQDVEVININDLSSALRPQVLQGESLMVRILKSGESPGQGVGYLDDGTMVVVEECARRVGEEVELVVTNILQTSAGRLIFGRPKGDGAPPTS